MVGAARALAAASVLAVGCSSQRTDRGSTDVTQVKVSEPAPPEQHDVARSTEVSTAPQEDSAPALAEVHEEGISTPTDEAPAVVTWPHVRVDLQKRIVEVDAFSGITSGWLEQIVCTPEGRVHETVVVALARPSHIHAALLLLGLEPGKPGSWERATTAEGGSTYAVVAPVGPKVRLTVRYERGGEEVEEPVVRWVRDANSGKLLPDEPFVFGGSRIVSNDAGITGYAADFTGSIAGLVTFGDETLGWVEVLPDKEAVLAPEWLANTEAMPEMGTPITLCLRPVD